MSFEIKNIDEFIMVLKAHNIKTVVFDLKFIWNTDIANGVLNVSKKSDYIEESVKNITSKFAEQSINVVFVSSSIRITLKNQVIECIKKKLIEKKLHGIIKSININTEERTEVFANYLGESGYVFSDRDFMRATARNSGSMLLVSEMSPMLITLRLVEMVYNIKPDEMVYFYEENDFSGSMVRKHYNKTAHIVNKENDIKYSFNQKVIYNLTNYPRNGSTSYLGIEDNCVVIDNIEKLDFAKCLLQHKQPDNFVIIVSANKQIEGITYSKDNKFYYLHANTQ